MIMIKIYANLIKEGIKTLDEIPNKTVREEVRLYLEQN